MLYDGAMSEDEIDDESAASPEGEAAPPPRHNPELLGHESAESTLLAAYNSGRLPHAWLIAGPQGVGKATLAFRFARFLFAQGESGMGGLFGADAAAKPQSLAVSPEHPAFRLVAGGGHPDLLVVERGYDFKRKKFRSEIVVDDTRAIGGFLHLTASQGGYRVVIVDTADDMNRNSANALLKVLEEPPKRAVLLLLSESPGRLLPTIRSRCRLIHVSKLPDQAVLAAISRYAPEVSAADVAALTALAEGSIGRALALAAGGGIEIQRGLYRLLGEIPAMDGESLHVFAEQMTRGEGDGFRILSELLPNAVATMVRLALGRPDPTPSAERATLARLASRAPLAQWVEVWRKICHLFAAAERIELDRKQTVLSAIWAVEEAAR
jgi:DNA polymerase-3 subunit delta'